MLFNLTKDFAEKTPKDVADVLSYQLSKIIKLSANLSVFSEECKIDKFKPLFKTGPEIDPKSWMASKNSRTG